MKIQLLLLWLCLSVGVTVQAQNTVVKGVVKDKKTGERLIGATVSVKGTSVGTSSNFDGEFTLKLNQPMPVTLVVSYIGYAPFEVNVTNADKPLDIKITENTKQLKDVVIQDSRITAKQKQAPLTVETMDALAIKETPAANFYEGLAHLKGVDLTSASIGFKIINTRGFNSTSPVRSLQLIDGVDNQSPGLNFSLGNFLGASELDVQRVDLIVGASGAYYGPNAFNGVINMQTKSPFQFPGLSASVKVGERSLFEGAVRFAQVFKNKRGEDKFAYKFNFFHMRANDWEAQNYDVTSQSPVGSNNPGGYDAVNRYGDEFVSQYFYTAPSSLVTVGRGYYLREGYNETDLVDYDTRNTKLNGSLHYKVTKDIEAIYASSFSTGTTVYQGDNRFSLKDIQFFQNRVEIRQENKFFIRAYVTNEDAGNTYDAYNTALVMQNRAKTDADWGTDYNNGLSSTLGAYLIPWYLRNDDEGLKLNQIPGANNQRLNFIENYWQTVLHDSLVYFHNLAREKASGSPSPTGLKNHARFDPGTYSFDTSFANTISTLNTDGGSKIFDRSSLYHIAGEYRFTVPEDIRSYEINDRNLFTKVYSSPIWAVSKVLNGICYVTKRIDVIVGGNFRLYAPNSRGTIFSDTGSVVIRNREGGGYIGLERKFVNDKLKISFTNRLDKNENFDLLWSPAATAVFVQQAHVFRVSVSSAIRNPTLSDQYILLDVGRATLKGNLSGYDSLVTIESVIDALNNGRDELVYFNIDPIQPEQVRTIEFGYRGSLFKDKLYYDINYYHSWYTHFIGYKIGADLRWPPGSLGPSSLPEAYRVAANAKDEVTTEGVTVGVQYFFRKYLGFNANYSLNSLDRHGSEDPLIPAFNTPKNKYNFGINGRDIDTKIGGLSILHWGYGINYKYQDGFIYEGSPQFTGDVPGYGMVDAQLNKKVLVLHCTFKLGASNLLDNRVYQVYGGPRVGRMAYFSVVFELDNWK